jgi:hypothetical protein
MNAHESTKKSGGSFLKRILFALLFIVIGFFIGYYWSHILGEVKESKSTFTTHELRNFNESTLKQLRDTTTQLLVEKNKGKFDSLEQLSNVRDSLLKVEGQITSSMIDAQKNVEAYNHLDALAFKIHVLIDSCDNIIKQGSLDLLQPTNAGLKQLIKDIKDKTDQLKQVAKTFATIADVVSAITGILATPILGPVAAAAK